MKRTIILTAAASMLAALAAPVFGQAKECTDEFKSATYQKWYDNRKEHQDVADQAAEEYLTTCPNDDSPYKTALKKFHDAYKVLTADVLTKKQFEEAYNTKKYADQIRLGKQILATDPDNSAVYIIMGLAGLGDASLLNESAQYAKKAIEMIEAGKPFKPFDTKDQPLAYLNWEIGKANLKTTPADAIPYLLKAARYESDLKKKSQLYLDLAAAYNDGPRAKQSEDYKQFLDKPESPESKLALANINQIIDRQIDALARAAALAPDAANKKAIMDVLTETYKDRNKSDAGLNELVAGILSKPIPDIPTPLTTLPATPSSSTPATGGSGTNGGAGANGMQTGSAKPVATPTPGNKPKSPRSN
jgi:hypothetical protein